MFDKNAHWHSNQKIVLILFILGVTAFFLLVVFAPFKGILNLLYPKSASQAAASIPTTCNDDLQTKINNTASGGTLTLTENCIYRQVVTINKPMTIDGAGLAQIRGSDVWTNWSTLGATWTSQETVPDFGVHGQCDSKFGERCHWPEQVFIDEMAQVQVASSQTPQEGQFKVDGTRKIILGSNPVGHKVEVTMRQSWINIQSNNVTIQRFTMKHAANLAQTAPLSTNAKNDITIQDNILSDTHGAIISMPISIEDRAAGNYSRRPKILRNDLSYGGQMALHGGGDDLLIQGNKVHNNHTEGYDISWEAGADKLVLTGGNSVIDNNWFYDNNGSGIWCDVQCKGLTISNNKVSRNSQIGIYFETGDGAKIFGNKVWGNGFGDPSWAWGSGIMSNSSGHVEIYDNILAWNADGIAVIEQTRSDRFPQVENYVHDNTIIEVGGQDQDGKGLIWDSTVPENDGAGPTLYLPSNNNRGIANKYWFTTGDQVAWCRFQWQGCQNVQTLTEFNTTTGEEGGRYLLDSEKDQILTSNELPTCPTCSDPNPPSSPTPIPTYAPPSIVPTATPSSVPSATAISTANPTATPITTPSPTIAPSVTPSPSATIQASATVTPTPTAMPTATSAPAQTSNDQPSNNSSSGNSNSGGGGSAPASTSGKIGDLNGDNKVNILDLSTMLRNWNRSGAGDLNKDGKVNILDLSVLLRSWNK